MSIISHIFSFLKIDVSHIVQKYKCNHCKTSYYSNKQKNNILLKLWLKFTISKLIVMLRFKQGASVRCISQINKQVFGMYSSIGYINNICKKVANNAEKKIEFLSKCNQNVAKVMMYDDTFPKSKEEGSVVMGVVNDEYGLIRGIGIVKDKKADTEYIMKKVLSNRYNPQFFISDYDTTYPVVIKKLLTEIKIHKKKNMLFFAHSHY